MPNHTIKFSVLGALTLSLLGASACVVDGSDDGTESAESDEAVTGQASVQVGANGKLEYLKDSTGDTVPDFSNAGYKGGGVVIPQVDAVQKLGPLPGDNRAAIQAAIDAMSQKPVGQRGPILLKKGTYRISGPIVIRASGVVLRGEGDDENGTVLVSTSTKSGDPMVQIEGGAPSYGAPVQITDKYVPVGSHTVTLASTDGLKVNDTISVERPETDAWVRAVKMSQYSGWAGTQRYERVITRIDGKTVTFDAPLTNSLDAKYGGGVVRKMTKDARISDVGVEHLRGLSLEKVKSTDDENHPASFIVLSNVVNGWVQNVTGARFTHAVVSVSDGAKWITVRRSTAMEPVGKRTPGNFYAFEISGGQLVLFHACTSFDGRHDYVLGSRMTGPNVFLESTRQNKLSNDPDNELGPHMRWSTGALFDSMVVQGANVSSYDRGDAGTGHGWSGANMVFWNVKSSDGYRCERPPTAHQWVFGPTSKVATKTHADMPCEIVSANKPMAVPSLYRRQLLERLGPNAVKALDD